ncbi:tol-pal system protein YbgF [Pseudaestuariivita atlantica]|uniref:Cell division coordinator CpoB n=1 Tax=Pseudaestuariivita atlantica TaxID=1317121 RepID=A0A0L1JTP8_9RHOB|nr:tol-pal system protein YbgF [Pseudaestuariivita atlantica]KNG94788.1 tol-pal system protein [Pseudaestuariivita atlantica]
MRFILVVVLALAGAPSFAQDQTLADIRQQLTMLAVEIQKLKRELSTTGVQDVTVQGSVLDRLDALEVEMQRLTAKTEQLEFRIGRVVKDGTNRIGDLEFRLVELEGGDVSQLGETSTLGGADLAAVAPEAPQPVQVPDGTQLAVGEKRDFDAALSSLEAGRFAQAADAFRAFRQAYPGSPFEPQALMGLGKALDGQGDTRSAARAWLDSYSGYPQSPVAAEALFRVGEALGRLDKPREACVTLGEVAVRFPGDPFVTEAEAARTALGCS